MSKSVIARVEDSANVTVMFSLRESMGAVEVVASRSGRDYVVMRVYQSEDGRLKAMLPYLEYASDVFCICGHGRLQIDNDVTGGERS